MAWTHGVADDYRDLLDRLRLFVTQQMTPAAQRWQQLRWELTATTQELILKGPGLAGADEIYVGIRSYEDANQGWYWWDLEGFTGYLAANPFYAQPGAISEAPAALTLFQYATPYWFFANGRRIVVVAKVGTVYESAYLGFMLPFATPSEHFYPMFVGGSMTAWGGRLRGRTDDGHRAFFHTRRQSDDRELAALIWMAGAWERATNTLYRTQPFPYCLRGLRDWGQTPAGQYLLVPVQYVRTAGPEHERHSFGALDGVFYVSGHNNAAENVVTVDGTQYFVVQNVHRTGWDEYAAIRMD